MRRPRAPWDRLIAEPGFSLVFGGGGPGLMGETARAARERGAPMAWRSAASFLRLVETAPEWAEELIIIRRPAAAQDAHAGAGGRLRRAAGRSGARWTSSSKSVTSARSAFTPSPILVVNIEGFFRPSGASDGRTSSAKDLPCRKIETFYRFVATPEAAMRLMYALGLAPRRMNSEPPFHADQYQRRPDATERRPHRSP